MPEVPIPDRHAKLAPVETIPIPREGFLDGASQGLLLGLLWSFLAVVAGLVVLNVYDLILAPILVGEFMSMNTASVFLAVISAWLVFFIGQGVHLLWITLSRLRSRPRSWLAGLWAGSLVWILPGASVLFLNIRAWYGPATLYG